VDPEFCAPTTLTRIVARVPAVFLAAVFDPTGVLFPSPPGFPSHIVKLARTRSVSLESVLYWVPPRFWARGARAESVAVVETAACYA
jgi:hypothetical protein